MHVASLISDPKKERNVSDFKVVVTDHIIRPNGLDLLRRHGGEVVVLVAHSSLDVLMDEVREADAMMARSVDVTREVVEGAPKLKIVSRHGVGYENVDIEACTRLGIAVSISSDANSQSVAEYALTLMMASAVLVNTARGGLVDETALHDALANGIIAAAGLDVFEDEPLPDDHPLTKLDSMICTAHVAGQTQESLVRTSTVAAENILAVLRGEAPEILVNPDVLENRSRVDWKG